MKHCFIFPRIPTALIFIALLILFLSFWIYLVNFSHSSISLFVIFFILSEVFSASYLILKQLVSCGESRPGPPNPPFHLGPGSLGLSVTKRALSHTPHASLALFVPSSLALVSFWPFVYSWQKGGENTLESISECFVISIWLLCTFLGGEILFLMHICKGRDIP